MQHDEFPASRIRPSSRSSSIATRTPPHTATADTRHSFASALLARGVPITDVAKWLGHRNINVTYATYGRLVSSAQGRAVDVLNSEYAEWSTAA